MTIWLPESGEESMRSRNDNYNLYMSAPSGAHTAAPAFCRLAFLAVKFALEDGPATASDAQSYLVTLLLSVRIGSSHTPGDRYSFPAWTGCFRSESIVSFRKRSGPSSFASRARTIYHKPLSPTRAITVLQFHYLYKRKRRSGPTGFLMLALM